MSFKCDQCENVYSRKDSLTRHKISVHKDTTTNKRKYPDDDTQVSNSPSIKQLLDPIDNLNEQAFPSDDCSLKRRDSTTDTEQSLFNDQPAKSFKFKHPCYMMVAGPSQSGKTTWTVRLLEKREECFQPAVDTILFYYSQWQKNYDDLKQKVPSTIFHQGIPSLERMDSLQNGVLVLDDLMEEVIRDSNLMNMFIVGSHHRNISVLFLM